MNKDNCDKIFINDLTLKCVIGTNESERKKKQKVIINIVLHTDLRKACHTDNLNDSTDYFLIEQKVVDLVKKSKFYLLEKLIQKIADICLENERVSKVDLSIKKPKALKHAKSAGIEISRSRG